MPEEETGTPTEATTVIIHFISNELFIIYVLEQWPQGKLKRQHRNKSKIHMISGTKGSTQGRSNKNNR
jgi:hypothetical protein